LTEGFKNEKKSKLSSGTIGDFKGIAFEGFNQC